MIFICLSFFNIESISLNLSFHALLVIFLLLLLILSLLDLALLKGLDLAAL